MHFYEHERLGLFIDGANLHATAKALDIDIDFKRLLQFFGAKGRLIRALYYTAVAEGQEFCPIRPLVDWLDYNGYTLITKPTKEFTDSRDGARSKAASTLNSPSTLLAWPMASTTSSSFPATAISAVWWPPCSKGENGSASSRRSRPSRRWLPTSCVGKPINSSTLPISKRS